MKRTALLFRATVATWVVAWFLPVVKDGTTLWLLRANPATDLYVGYYLWVLSFAILTWTVREASR